MFSQGIEIAAKYTRAIHSIRRNYGSSVVHPGTASLFFINSDGWALTCGHIADQIAAGETLAKKAEAFRKELSALQGTQKQKKLLKNLEKKYNYSKNTPFELHNSFMNCVEGGMSIKVIKHKKFDVALIQFESFSRLLCDTFPTFPADTSMLQPGKFLCRLGFPFPEFTNFKYDADNDRLVWVDSGRHESPRFPIEGMITRRVLDKERNIFAFEMSTPGLRGQSGGPAFDVDGKVWGMQFQTAHLDLNFDVDQEVMRDGSKKRVTDSAFLHVGRCIHIDVLRSFLKENNVAFVEG
jgi:hypothetical protein